MVDIDHAAVIQSAAVGVHRNWYPWANLLDLQQEGWTWYYSHPQQVAKLEEYDSVKNAEYYLFAKVRDAMLRYARSEKAQQSGYAVEDEVTYGSQSLQKWLPVVISWETPEKPAEGHTGLPKGGSDPAVGGDWMASYVDVKSAWEKTDSLSQTWLSLRHGEGLTFEECGARMGVSQPAAFGAVKRAEKKLLEHLGGGRLHECDMSCECRANSWKTGPLTRRPRGLAQEWPD